jgi:alpha-tubulin suppressor-like RCC1 family protein
VRRARLLLLVATMLFVAVGSAGGRATQLQTKRGIATGAYHTCSVTNDGGVSCWGKNEEGQLGDGTVTDRHLPAPVAGLPSGVALVSLSYAHGCAVLVSGAVKCWGRNDEGQLGDGTTQDRWTPGDVRGLPPVVSVAVGKNHACALSGGGAVYCWGRNEQGQLGVGSTFDKSLTPVAVPSLASGVVSLVAGKNYTCALLPGEVRCWGRNGEGQLGNGGEAGSSVPVPVVGLSRDVRAIGATGDFICALTGSESVKCWGENDHGQVGDGSTVNRRVPVAVQKPGKNLIAVAVGANHACTLSKTSAVRCWGRNDHGQLGDGTTRESHVPVAVRNLGSGVATISAGASGHFVCALTRDGIVKCWGRNTYGQLGNGTTIDSSMPTSIMRLP